MRILIALDRSDLAEIVLEHGLDEAVRRGGADLDIVTFVTHTLDIPGARTWLDSLVREDLDTFEVHGTVTLHVMTGEPVNGIVVLARDLEVDLLVIGQFHVPSRSEAICAVTAQLELPTLVVGAEGIELEAQCRACQIERRTSNGEHLFCADHAGGRMPDLVTRLPPMPVHGSRLW
jgi:nucleotide-binding universal stress UspA family protein